MLGSGLILPRLSGALPFMRDKLGYLSREAERQGDVALLGLGRPTYLLSNPDDVRRVLISNSDSYARPSRIAGSRARRFFGEGVVTMTGAGHLKQRRILQPAFHHSAIDRFAGAIAITAEREIAGWTRRKNVDVHAEILAMMREINLQVLFGDDAHDVRDLFHHTTFLRRQRQEYILGQPATFFQARRNSARSYEAARLQLDQRITDIVRNRRKSGDSSDMIGMLAHAAYEDGSQMSDALIADELRTLSVAGYETVAEAVTWSVILLFDNRDAASRVREEACAASSLSSRGDFEQLDFTRLVMSEAMRLYPPSWLIVRVAVEDDVLADGTVIPNGSRVYISPWVIHRMAKYHPDPERFDPSRFTRAAVASRPRLTYLPFGAGRRQCIGENLAWLEGVLALAAIYRLVVLQRITSEPVIPQPNVTLRPSKPVIVQASIA